MAYEYTTLALAHAQKESGKQGLTELVRRGQHDMDTNRYFPIEYHPADSSDTSSDSS